MRSIWPRMSPRSSTRCATSSKRDGAAEIGGGHLAEAVADRHVRRHADRLPHFGEPRLQREHHRRRHRGIVQPARRFVGGKRFDHRPAGGGLEQSVEAFDKAAEHRIGREETPPHVPELAALPGAGEHQLAVIARLAFDDHRRRALVRLRPVAAVGERGQLVGEVGVVARHHHGAVVEMVALAVERGAQRRQRHVGQSAAFADGFRQRARPGGKMRRRRRRQWNGREFARARRRVADQARDRGAARRLRRMPRQQRAGIGAAEAEGIDQRVRVVAIERASRGPPPRCSAHRTECAHWAC